MATLRMKSPLAAQLELTKACNLACIHCYNYWRYIENNKVCEQDDFSRNFESFKFILNELIRKEIPSITFTGGEPFIRRDLLYPLVKIAKEAKMQVRINTNGSLITESDVNEMVKCGVDSVLISFSSNVQEEHSTITNTKSYNKTLEAIKLILKTNIVVRVNMVVSNINIQSVKSNGLFLKNIGVSHFCATPSVSCPCAEKHSEISLEASQIKKVLDDLLFLQEQGVNVDVLEPLTHCMFSPEERIKYMKFLTYRCCSAGISDIAISPDGDVRACILSNTVEGNLFSDGWEKCWDDLAKWANSDLLPEECLDCAIVDFCGGGCRVAALANTNAINGKDPYMDKPIQDFDLSAFCKHEESNLKHDALLIFDPDLRMRQEEFGGIIFGRNMSHLFLQKEAFNFVKNMWTNNKYEKFSIDSISKKHIVDHQDLTEFITHLVRNKFILTTK